jgi:transposase
MTLLYGWAERGDRVPGAVPFNWEENITMLGALNSNGLACMMTVNGGTDGDVFLAFVRELLVPVLCKGQVVVLDNLSAHKVAGVREEIESTGAELLYLPPYSPDLNPIEQCWSKLKNLLRKVGAETRDTLDKTLGEAMKCVTASDAEGWISECGYI